MEEREDDMQQEPQDLNSGSYCKDSATLGAVQVIRALTVMKHLDNLAN